MLSRIRWFLVVASVLLLAVFSLANTQSVSVGMPLVFRREIPLAMLLAASALIGFMVGSLWTAWMLRRRRKAESAAPLGPASTESSSSRTTGSDPAEVQSVGAGGLE